MLKIEFLIGLIIFWTAAPICLKPIVENIIKKWGIRPHRLKTAAICYAPVPLFFIGFKFALNAHGEWLTVIMIAILCALLVPFLACLCTAKLVYKMNWTQALSLTAKIIWIEVLFFLATMFISTSPEVRDFRY